MGCLGQTGEQDELPALLEQTSVMRELGPFRFRVPAPEEQVTLATLQRMYRHFYIRFTDLLNLTGLVRAGRLDFTRLRASTQRWSIWPGVATLLKIASDYNERTGVGPLPLPDFVVRLGPFRGRRDLRGETVFTRAYAAAGFATCTCSNSSERERRDTFALRLACLCCRRWLRPHL